MKRVIRQSIVLLLPCLLVLVSGCISVTPGAMVEIPQSMAPIFEDIAIGGLVVRDERLASRSIGVGRAFGTASASGTASGPAGTVHGRASGHSQSTLVANSSTYETYDSYELQQDLRILIEDARLARRVVPEARTALEGVVLSMKPSTGIGRIAWNVVNTVSCLFLVGGPYLGSAEADVQLRLYRDMELVRTFEGHGTASWRVPYFGIVHTLPQAKRRAQIAAAGAALRAATAELVELAPKIVSE